MTAAVTYADLKIEVEREAPGSYRVRLRHRLDTSAADDDLVVRSHMPAVFDLAALRAASLDPQAYGRLLADAQIRRRFGEARAAARALGVPLRLRLALDPLDVARSCRRCCPRARPHRRGGGRPPCRRPASAPW